MTSHPFFIEEAPQPIIEPELYYSTHRKSFGKSAVGYSNFKERFPECFEDGLHYTVLDPLNNEDDEVNCIV